MSSTDLSKYRAQHAAIQKEYAKQAPGWTLSNNDDHLTWVIEQVDLQPHFEVLDVAAGTGLLSRQIAPHVKSVVALDLTSEMLAHTVVQGAVNVRCEQGAAEAMPYPPGSFDMIATRFSLHHFQDPAVVLAEMYRVCRVGGQLLLIDIVAPEEPALAERYNHFERLRDTTHTTALVPTALTTLVSDAGFAVAREFHRDVEVDLQNWLDFTQAEPQVRVTIERAIQEELHGGKATGMRPYVSDGRLKFLHLWWVIVGRKG